MAVVARLVPRHWDGRRLLRFLTGLALIALTVAPPMAPAASAVARPAGTVRADSPAAASGTTPAAASGTTPAAAGQATATAATATADRAATHAARADECRHDASGVRRVARTAAGTALPAGVAPGAQGSRAPPRA